MKKDFRDEDNQKQLPVEDDRQDTRLEDARGTGTFHGEHRNGSKPADGQGGKGGERDFGNLSTGGHGGFGWSNRSK